MSLPPSPLAATCLHRPIICLHLKPLHVILLLFHQLTYYQLTDYLYNSPLWCLPLGLLPASVTVNQTIIFDLI